MFILTGCPMNWSQLMCESGKIEHSILKGVLGTEGYDVNLGKGLFSQYRRET